MRLIHKSYFSDLLRLVISIIFVHGLGSNPDTTWRAKYSTNISEAPAKSQPRNKRYACWITDFLPYDIPSSFPGDIRLFFYNYDSYWANDAVDTRLMKLGNEFLGHIKRRIPKSDIVSFIDLLSLEYSADYCNIGTKAPSDLCGTQLRRFGGQTSKRPDSSVHGYT